MQIPIHCLGCWIPNCLLDKNMISLFSDLKAFDKDAIHLLPRVYVKYPSYFSTKRKNEELVYWMHKKYAVLDQIAEYFNLKKIIFSPKCGVREQRLFWAMFRISGSSKNMINELYIKSEKSTIDHLISWVNKV